MAASAKGSTNAMLAEKQVNGSSEFAAIGFTGDVACRLTVGHGHMSLKVFISDITSGCHGNVAPRAPMVQDACMSEEPGGRSGNGGTPVPLFVVRASARSFVTP